VRFVNWILAGPRALIAWIHAAFCALLTPEGRRAWAVILCGGCGIVMSGLAYWGMYLNRSHPAYTFWLATEAMGIVLIVISAITGLLVKRNIGGSVNVREGTGSVNIEDREDGPLPNPLSPAPILAAPPPASPELGQ
jgi:hypothetical protein